MLKKARTAIRANDPGARVVLAGLADASWKVLNTVYKAGGRRSFDVATINIFTGPPRLRHGRGAPHPPRHEAPP